MKKTRNNHHEITAFIYDKRGRVLSIGKNSYIKTHPYQAKCAEEVGEGYKVFLHAEIDAINKCTNLDKAHRISIFRFTKDGKYALAKPCKICENAISKIPQIKVIEHT